MDTPATYFAPAERATKHELARGIELTASSPVMSGILKSVGGLIAILDEHRQIVAMNDSFARMLGISDVKQTLGLRLGEAVNCIYSARQPGGCGTSEYCSTCGAAIAMVTGMATKDTVERDCAVTIKDGYGTKDIVLKVRCQPVEVEGTDLLLLFLRNITKQYQKAALERVFFHDIGNMLTALVGASEMMIENDKGKLAATINKASQYLLREVAVQRCLSQNEISSYQPSWKQAMIKEIIDDLRDLFAHHGLAHDKSLSFPHVLPDTSVKTDMSLLLRILSNMLINSLEATAKDSEVRLSVTEEDDSVSFHVWNEQSIPDAIARRIFQRNFSTKAEEGRGLGTFSMKLFGEQVLHGKVSFTTSPENGTTFTLEHPLS